MEFEGKPAENENPPIEPVADIEKEEERKAVIEKAQEGRLEIFNEALRRILKDLKKYANENLPKPALDLLLTVFDFTIAGIFTMSAKAISGKTLTEEKLNPKDRIMYGLIVMTDLMAYLLAVYGLSEKDIGKIEMAGKIYLGHWALFLAQKIPELTKIAEQLQEPLNKIFITCIKTTEGLRKNGGENMTRLIDKIRNGKNSNDHE